MSQRTNKENLPDDIVILWLDESITDFQKQLEYTRKTNLFSYVQSMRPFIDRNTCYEYIQKINDIKILLIVSGSFGETFLPLIHELTQITFVYVLCFDTEKHETWTKQWNKIRGVYNDEKSLVVRLHDDLRALNQTNLSFGLFESGQRSLKDLTSEQASFMWSQLIIEVLLRLPHTSEAKTEMVTECRSNYKDNPKILESIDDFEKNYQSDTAIQWYTKNTFAFQLFNRAFRQQDFEIIFKYRYFLLDLYKGIHDLHVRQYRERQDRLTVYRGQTMFKHELMKLKENVGRLISINTFFSTSASQIVAVSFCGNGEYESQGIVSVMFEIEIDLSTTYRPFASIESLSELTQEREILFAMGHVFQVEYVELETDTIWSVRLVWDHRTSTKLKEMKQLVDLVNFYTGQHIGEHPSVLAFGYFLSTADLLRQALRFYEYLLRTLPEDHRDRGILHNNLGEVLRKLNYFNQARFHFEKALEFSCDTLTFHHPFWAIIHSNIALLNINCEKANEAIKFYRCAELILSHHTTYMEWESQIYLNEALAIVYHGMAVSFIFLNQKKSAKYYEEKALNIELGFLPQDHPTFVETYHILGLLSMRLENYDEAMKNCETALRIAQINLLPKDQRLILLHVNIADLAFNAFQDVPKTLRHCTYAQELIEQAALTKSSDLPWIAYQKLGTLYLHLHLLPLAVQMWERCIEGEKKKLIAANSAFDLYDGLIQDRIGGLQTVTDTGSMSKCEARSLCDFANTCRTVGYISYALERYLYLLEHQPVTDDPHFDRTHKSYLHNNLAACYQDLNDNDNALHHYQLSLDIIKKEHIEGTIETAIMHYNIALIYHEKNELHKARKYLHQSLIHFHKQTSQTHQLLDVKTYIALIKIYRQWNDWYMVRNYYERIIDQMKKDAASPSIISKYEKYLEDAIEKISMMCTSC